MIWALTSEAHSVLWGACRMGFIIVASLCSEGATAVAVSARDAERGTGRRIFQLLFPELSSNCPMSSHALEALDGV